MIAVDTSVWVAALRGPSAEPASTLGALLDSDDVVLPLPVRLELLTGVSAHQRDPLRRALTALPVVQPTDETWARLESWIEPAAKAGHHFALTDLLIAALAEDCGALVWSFDRDFERMAQLKIARLYA